MSKFITQQAYDDGKEELRLRVMEAMDKVMNAFAMGLDVRPTRNDVGCQDADLPTLFRALDSQFALNCERLGVLAVDDIDAANLAADLDKAEQRWASQ